MGQVLLLLCYLSFRSRRPSAKKFWGRSPLQRRADNQRAKREGAGGSRRGGIARLLPFPFRLSKRKAEGGLGAPRSRASSLRGKNSAFLWPNQNEASPATCLNTWKAGHHKKILFSLEEEKIRRVPCLPAGRQNEKSKEYFSVVWRACRAVAGLASLVWFRSAVFDKMSSSQTVKTHQNLTFRKLTDFFVGGAKRRPLIFGGNSMLFGALTRASLPAKTRFASRAI